MGSLHCSELLPPQDQVLQKKPAALTERESIMPQRYRPSYPPEFRRQMVELVRSGRDPEQLAREFEPSARTIRNWVAQADPDEGRRARPIPPATSA
jgi:transposase-like protein